jgi:hypothetical protein
MGFFVALYGCDYSRERSMTGPKKRYGLSEALPMLDCCDLGNGGLLSTNVISHSIEWTVARS